MQEAIRTLGPELCQGAFAEEMRQALLRAPRPPRGQALARPSRPAVAPAAAGGEHPRAGELEFKFQREHVQDLTVFFTDIEGYTQKFTTLDMTSQQ